ncbi:hypothetical protein Lupro_02310 [Lutibacter profundi]|uniref:Uncharacterized protein n=1 Tax=Lutibacter profundi TaxID=1622118 RepID=A0A120IE06_9FLAO|nr:hypothetical protein [Lutibacter profundi]AMC10152.1 hypothetical protein Lupro_02310 [Lutibacter profundi]
MNQIRKILAHSKKSTLYIYNFIIRKPYYKTSNNFWVQKIPYKKIDDRLSFFISECKNKNVLHFGCTDWPIFNSKNNLHIKLANVCKSIDGFDVDKEGIEHVDNVADFLKFISKIDATKFYITAPNCFSKSRIKNYHVEKNEFIEVVHPDHNCWYSPYTLKNQIEKYSTLEVKMVYLLEKGKMVCCEAMRK